MNTLRGTVVSGRGDYAQWIARYQEQYHAKTGLVLFPGTLNLHLAVPFELPPDKIIRLEGHGYGSRVSVSMVPVGVLERPGVILRPDLPPWAAAEDEAERLRTWRSPPMSSSETHTICVTGMWSNWRSS